MAITVNESTKVITVEDGTYAPGHLYAAAENITRHGDTTKGYYSYGIPYNINITNGGLLTCSNAILVFEQNLSSAGSRISVSSTGSLSLTNCTVMTPSYGFLSLANLIATDTYFLYSRGITFGINCKMTRCYLRTPGSTYLFGGYGNEMNNISIVGGTYGLIPQQNPVSDNDIKIFGTTYGILLGYNQVDVTHRNIVLVNCANDGYFSPTANKDADTNLIDCNVNVNKISAASSGTSGRRGNLRLISTFIFLINQGDDAIAKIYDKDGNLHEEVEISGETSKEVIYYRRYFEFGTPNIDIINEYEPFEIIVSKPGYDDLILRNVTVVPGEKTYIRGCLFEIEPEPIYITSISETHCTNELANDGSITIEVLGGVEPYEYSIDGGDTWSESNIFEDLPANVYEVKVKGAEDNESDIFNIEIVKPNTKFFMPVINI